MPETAETIQPAGQAGAGFKLVASSLIGLTVFFVPLTINGKRTIVLDHLVQGVSALLGSGVGIYALLLIIAGAAEPWIAGNWRRSLTDRVLTLFKAFGVIAAVMALTGWGPAFLHAPDMLPFLFEKLVISVGLIVPVGAAFLVFIVGYGLMEMLGVIAEPVMKPVWRTPGRSSVDAVASFVGSYSIGLLITDRVYSEGRYSAREAAIIATGFSTVSVTFMLIVAKALDLMDSWNLYFWTTLVITFGVTAVTARMPPLSRLDSTRPVADPPAPTGSRLVASWQAGVQAAAEAPGFAQNLAMNFKDGLLMTIRILPSIMSVGLAGLLLAQYTPVFKILGLLFYPIAWLWRVSDPMALSQAIASELAEMFLPALLTGPDADFVTRFTVAVTSVSAILFFRPPFRSFCPRASRCRYPGWWSSGFNVPS